MTDETTTAVEQESTPLPAAVHLELLTSAMSRVAHVRTLAGVPAWAIELCDAIEQVAAYCAERDRVSMST